MKKSIKIVLISIIGLIFLFSILGIIDYQMVKNSKEPIFCYYKDVMRDGGSKVYEGIGYVIVNYYNPILNERKLRIGILHYPKDPFPPESRLLKWFKFLIFVIIWNIPVNF